MRSNAYNHKCLYNLVRCNVAALHLEKGFFFIFCSHFHTNLLHSAKRLRNTFNNFTLALYTDRPAFRTDIICAC